MLTFLVCLMFEAGSAGPNKKRQRGNYTKSCFLVLSLAHEIDSMSKVIPGRTEREAQFPFGSLPIHHGVSLDDLFALDDDLSPFFFESFVSSDW